MASWSSGLTPEQIREAEMARGAEVTAQKHGAVQEFLAKTFDPDYKPPTPTHYVSRESKEYNARLKETNKNREDFKCDRK